MRLLISLQDVAEFVPVSTNIPPALINPYIREAQTHDVRLPAPVWAALDAALDAAAPEFDPDEFGTEEFATDATNAGWADIQLARLWYEGVRPLLCCHAARRLLLWHGTHVTPVGLEELVQDSNRTPASSQRRAVLSADLQAKCSTYQSLLGVTLAAYLPAAPAGCGTSSIRRPSRGGLSVSAL